MAALLDCSNGSRQLAQMHPFFRKAAAPNHDFPSRDPSPKGHLGFDGTTEEENGPTNERVSHPEPNRWAPTSHITLSDSHDEASGDGSWSIVEGDDLEHGHRRIKRRRISSQSKELYIGAQDGTNTIQQTWHDQLEAAAREIPETVVPKDPQSNELNSQPFNLNPAPAQPHINKPTQPIHIGAPEHSVLGPPTEASPLQEMSTSTPKRRIIVLNGKGKLTNSPNRSPRRSPRTNNNDANDPSHEVKKPGRQSKKIGMKNGKFVSSLRITLPHPTKECGQKIEAILSSKKNESLASILPGEKGRGATIGNKTTHPFFLGKLAVKAEKQSSIKSETSSVAPASEDEATSPKAPKPWKDIVFKSQKPFQDKSLSPPSIWPPASIQNVQPDNDVIRSLPVLPPIIASLKSKQRNSTIGADEDVLQAFAECLKHDTDPAALLHVPTRRIMSGKELAGTINCEATAAYGSAARLNALRYPLIRRIESTPSPFDKGMAAGPHMWTQEYGPTCWQEVLQGQSQVLYDWLSNLRIHQVQTGKLQTNPKHSAVKKGRKRKSDEMDDFIADSDDETLSSNSSGKNAILIVGPSGCGKTASVYAVAQQLGFEVFEIHPGMRRSARDIQEKVGDMTQNHLVQQAHIQSGRPGTPLDDAVATQPMSESLPASQHSIASFMAVGTGEKKNPTGSSNKESKARPQKQSLILFEEVDILFDEDKGFWTGVQSLISNSKRPVIMTCNDLLSIPLDELDLFSVLAFDRSDPVLAVDHLQCIAAAEGHLLGRQSIQNLYASKGQDLRASITELNLWCQMTLGSHQGGLDWMLPHDEKHQSGLEGSIIRIVSQDTFITGLDLLPVQFSDWGEIIDYTQKDLDVSTLDWVKDDFSTEDPGKSCLQALDKALFLSEARSAMDLLDCEITPVVAGMVKGTSAHDSLHCARDDLVQLHVEHLITRHMSRLDITDAFETLMEDNRIGLPMVPGRKAPSLDNAAQSVVTDVAPYVRCIVAHDQRLEQIRNELGGGPQGKRQRKTRAARAALEGGSKGSTRRDKWFPEGLDFPAVLATGNAWPQLKPEEAYFAPDTPSSSMATDGEVEAIDSTT
ncbi:hypothetical protein, variant [Exophiala xenobiotica]|uniref:AAA+ ATPase domain-containing protein n=1 Tax=Exophiala xenobiotica TaxID=348802 RepID=A0A0D2F123_9EURO|nr:hypothetical protein, variant [Exophiala xenobiotica]KIW60635.1 hypothetical protein, variant [Exophiala xenobiotica]